MYHFLQTADLIVGYFGYNEKRNKIIDYPHPAGITTTALLIPNPTVQMKNYLVLIWQPFQPQVRKRFETLN